MRLLNGLGYANDGGKQRIGRCRSRCKWRWL